MFYVKCLSSIAVSVFVPVLQSVSYLACHFVPSYSELEIDQVTRMVTIYFCYEVVSSFPWANNMTSNSV
jgi:hypothetical protein